MGMPPTYVCSPCCVPFCYRPSCWFAFCNMLALSQFYFYYARVRVSSWCICACSVPRDSPKRHYYYCTVYSSASIIDRPIMLLLMVSAVPLRRRLLVDWSRHGPMIVCRVQVLYIAVCDVQQYAVYCLVCTCTTHSSSCSVQAIPCAI